MSKYVKWKVVTEMQRNMELVRDLLVKIEEDTSKGGFSFVAEEGYKFTNDEIEYHLELMINAGLIDGKVFHTFDGAIIDIKSLTWQGHDFLDAARNDKVWEKAEATAQDKGMDLSSLPLDIVKDLLVESTKALLGF